MDAHARARLVEVIVEAQRRGFAGEGAPENHLDHALGFRLGAGDAPDVAVDLGSGSGLPGVPLAMCWPESRWTLVEANGRRADFLRAAVERLGLAGRVEVCHDRAERVGRAPRHRAAAQVVVARGFGSPAVTAECAAPLLRRGGRLVVSEPPGGRPGRWPPEGLSTLGMRPGKPLQAGAAYQVIEQVDPCPDRFPRRTGVPAKRPLFCST